MPPRKRERGSGNHAPLVFQSALPSYQEHLSVGGAWEMTTDRRAQDVTPHQTDGKSYSNTGISQMLQGRNINPPAAEFHTGS